ncbi:MAG: DUF2333 family protein [Alphaproteobacteria bacterium]|nr:DUF2333 family protein [Alphaproteobacteria bacterium]
MIWIHTIDDDLDFAPPDAVAAGGSRAIATAAALVTREVDAHRWTPNDPFFLPGAALDNMPNFQLGMVAALARFAVEMTDQLGRTRGSSDVDPDLEKAAGLLKYPGDVWVFDPTVSLAPTATSESQYRAAVKALHSYNRRLAAGAAVFDRRVDNLQGVLDRFAADIGAASAALDQRVRGAGWLIDIEADDLFYRTKGRLYAYHLILGALQTDFARVIEERDLRGAWEQMLTTTREAVGLAPLVVINGAPDGLILPSHLAAQGFYVLRARTQLREITNILQK